MLKIKILNVSKKELLKDLQRAPEFDQSALFKKVYEEEYGVFGGSPFGALVGDYDFGKHPDDIELLEQISHVAAAAHAPFLTAAAPDLLNLQSLHDPGRASRPGEDFRHHRIRQVEELPPDRKIRATSRSALPRVLGRLPYGKDTKPVEDFAYEEHVDGSDHCKYLWMNAAYALARG